MSLPIVQIEEHGLAVTLKTNVEHPFPGSPCLGQQRLPPAPGTRASTASVARAGSPAK